MLKTVVLLPQFFGGKKGFHLSSSSQGNLDEKKNLKYSVFFVMVIGSVQNNPTYTTLLLFYKCCKRNISLLCNTLFYVIEV